MEDKAISQYIPLDKSWIIRMGVLDIVNGYQNIEKFLDNQGNLNDDLKALQRISRVWAKNKPLDVGESGTLYRFLKFASWKLGLAKEFIISGTLQNRSITNDPDIVTWSQEKLLTLDNNTSQWASASVLLGDKERLQNPPFKLQVTYDSVTHWWNQREKGECWMPRYDETILRQAKTYLSLLAGNKVQFDPQQAEDYCFAYAFDFIDAVEGEKRWPNLRGHESDRIKEMEEMLEKARFGQKVDSRDHRVVQALAMWGKVNKKEVGILYPESVNKSWPQFWSFLENLNSPI